MFVWIVTYLEQGWGLVESFRGCQLQCNAFSEPRCDMLVFAEVFHKCCCFNLQQISKILTWYSFLLFPIDPEEGGSNILLTLLVTMHALSLQNFFHPVANTMIVNIEVKTPNTQPESLRRLVMATPSMPITKSAIVAGSGT